MQTHSQAAAHMHICKTNTYHTPPWSHTPPSSKLVVVNEAADPFCAVEPIAPQWTPDMACTAPHWATCNVAWQGMQANIGPWCCDNTGTNSFTFLVEPVASHSHLFNCNCYYEVKHCGKVGVKLCVNDFMGHSQELVLWCLYNRKGAHWLTELSKC